jgi:hypothetical protein
VLIRNRRFAATVNDIVVEFGSARYRSVMDRFVHGEAVPDAVLRQVWQNTTQPQAIWDVPIYEDFFRAVRAVNASLSRATKKQGYAGRRALISACTSQMVARMKEALRP